MSCIRKKNFTVNLNIMFQTKCPAHPWYSYFFWNPPCELRNPKLPSKYSNKGPTFLDNSSVFLNSFLWQHCNRIYVFFLQPPCNYYYFCTLWLRVSVALTLDNMRILSQREYLGWKHLKLFGTLLCISLFFPLHSVLSQSITQTFTTKPTICHFVNLMTCTGRANLNEKRV